MIGRRVIIILSLLSALVACAFLAPAAAAEVATTAYTCRPEKKPGPEAKGFTDEHCTKEAGGELVQYVHKLIEPEKFTEATATNEETSGNTVPARFKVKFAGINVELEAGGFTSCKGGSSVMNVEGPKAFATGSACGEFTKVVVNNPSNCAVSKETIKLSEKIFYSTRVISVPEVEDEMFVEFEPPAGEPFASFKLIGEKCALKELNFEVTGAARANIMTKPTPLDGSTLKFTTTGTAGSLRVGKLVAEFAGTFTPRMAPEDGQETNPIALTTLKII